MKLAVSQLIQGNQSSAVDKDTVWNWGYAFQRRRHPILQRRRRQSPIFHYSGGQPTLARAGYQGLHPGATLNTT